MRFKDKVAIVTGGTGGIGKAAVLGFVKEGASVVINGRNKESLNEVSEKILSMGGTVTTVQGDITKKETTESIVDKAMEEYGKIDILFNYVGGEPDLKPTTPFLDQDEEFWDKMIELNLKSTVRTCKAVCEKMVKNNYGKIINTGAMSGRTGGPNMALYSAVKGGIIAFTKALSIEMAPYNINVNCVSPGPTWPPGFEKLFGKEGLERVKHVSLFKRIGTSEEVASMVMYLASDDASFITGQAIAVDGGATMV